MLQISHSNVGHIPNRFHWNQCGIIHIDHIASNKHRYAEKQINVWRILCNFQGALPYFFVYYTDFVLFVVGIDCTNLKQVLEERFIKSLLRRTFHGI